MIRLYIIFGILGYIVPATIVARVFFFRTLKKMYEEIKRRVAIDFKESPNRHALAERNRRENAKSSLQLGILFVFLLWPFFLIGMLVTGDKSQQKEIHKLEIRKAELQDQLITLNSLNPEDLPNIRVSIELLQEQLNEIEGKLKQYE